MEAIEAAKLEEAPNNRSARMSEGSRSSLLRLPEVEYRWNEPLSIHTTFRVGGNVACLALPGSEESLATLMKTIREEGLKSFLLGGGSNVVPPDGPIEAVAIRLDHCSSSIRPCENGRNEELRIYAGAGVRISSWLRFCLQNGYSGMEFLIGIPGSIGGSLVMNAGAGGGCMADSLLWIDVLDTQEGRRRRIDRSDLSCEYRSMGLEPDWVVLGACFRLEERAPSKAELKERMKQRKRTQPLGLPSAGCIFKNPPGLSAGALIDRAGLKGMRIGDAQVSEKHANWIVNLGNAKAWDILALIRLIEKEVFNRFAIRLEREVKIL